MQGAGAISETIPVWKPFFRALLGHGAGERASPEVATASFVAPLPMRPLAQKRAAGLSPAALSNSAISAYASK